MKITSTSRVDFETDEPADAIEITIAGVTVLVNRHTGSVRVENGEHVDASEGEHNTLRVRACPPYVDPFPPSLADLLGAEATEHLQRFGPGLYGMMAPSGGLSDIIARLGAENRRQR